MTYGDEGSFSVNYENDGDETHDMDFSSLNEAMTEARRLVTEDEYDSVSIWEYGKYKVGKTDRDDYVLIWRHPATEVSLSAERGTGARVTDKGKVIQVAYTPARLPDEDEDDDPDASEQIAKLAEPVRMVDWAQSWKAPFLVGGVVAFGGVCLVFGNGPAVNKAIWIGVLVGAWTLIVQLRGIYFNGDRLSYPILFFRRSVRLSHIADANCQATSGEDDPLSFVLSFFGTPNGSSRSKRYTVNLSGDFGARRVIFHDKYKRDEFLSLLRRSAPNARITRWV